MRGDAPTTATAHPTPVHSRSAEARDATDERDRRRRVLRSRDAVGATTDGSGAATSEDTFVDHEDIAREDCHVGRTAFADVGHGTHLRLDLAADLASQVHRVLRGDAREATRIRDG